MFLCFESDIEGFLMSLYGFFCYSERGLRWDGYDVDCEGFSDK